MSLVGKRVLVVGASSGIGRATAEAAAAAGARVATAARRPDQPGDPAVVADVRDPDECERLIADAVAAMGGIDMLVYAPALLPLGPLSGTDADVWRAVLETNVMGAALVSSAALPHLRAARGRVVFLSSDSSLRPRPGLVAYACGKAALNALAAGLRDEEPDVEVSLVLVGPTMTGIADAWDMERAAEYAVVWDRFGHQKPGAVMTAEDVAAEVVHILASAVCLDEVLLHARSPSGG
jgi:NAD(P)-dependent dehydrogenase (short-subunit alcohol dehydrogenase family)